MSKIEHEEGGYFLWIPDEQCICCGDFFPQLYEGFCENCIPEELEEINEEDIEL